ncbi:MAG: hypothetical protein ACRBB0_02635 [Pelagimonas sp.]|uniref:hypothetical protein n=1 Tax=Pelagimonas sp. TaxID=2073170 RepID=UPI003D6A4D35
MRIVFTVLSLSFASSMAVADIPGRAGNSAEIVAPVAVVDRLTPDTWRSQDSLDLAKGRIKKGKIKRRTRTRRVMIASR